jgi:hypothetical protein
MKTEAALCLFQYWNRLRNGTAAPARMDIEPFDIREVLSHTFILESSGQSSDMNFRLAGTALSNLFDRPLRGSPARSLFQDQHRAVISRLMRNCYQDSSVILLGLDATTRSGRHTILEILLLPLQDETEGHRILGCIVPHQHQFWHGLEPVSSLDLHSIRVIDPDREPLFLANRPEVPLPPALMPAEDSLQFGAPKAGMHLLVIQGGKSRA